MCGIAAIISPDAAKLRPRIDRMLWKLANRGPDGCGIWSDDECIMGHVRLSIIDLAGGAQPMTNPSAAVVFNGELYGFRKERHSYDYPFSTGSDTELLLAAYSKYGTAMCRHLKGMFAFALWDGERLICGRDRFGEKPLYYATGNNKEFIVASEPGAILASGLVTPHVDRKALAAFLRMGWLPEGMSMFREIRQLEPGHFLVHENGKATIGKYWQPPAPITIPVSMGEAAEEFRRLMDIAVERCLVSDVGTGLLLSGGLDSTTVAAIASTKTKIRSFAFGMAGARNELPYARAAARHYGLPLEESLVGNMDFSGLMLEMPDIYNEPLADTSCLPTVMLCRHVASEVKVALGGDGGDELLGGYGWYRRLDERAERIGKVSGTWTRHAAAHFQGRSLCDSSMLKEAGLEPWYPVLPNFLDDTDDDAMRMDIMGFLPSDVLKKTDRASMSCGLELRSPFLDADLADFLISLPTLMKTGGDGKVLMRETFGSVWPEEIRNRPKQGFGMDFKSIIARPDMSGIVNEYLDGTNMAVHDLLPRKWFRKYASLRNGFSWALLVLSIWCGNMKAKGWL